MGTKTSVQKQMYQACHIQLGNQQQQLSSLRLITSPVIANFPHNFLLTKVLSCGTGLKHNWKTLNSACNVSATIVPTDTSCLACRQGQCVVFIVRVIGNNSSPDLIRIFCHYVCQATESMPPIQLWHYIFMSYNQKVWIVSYRFYHLVLACNQQQGQLPVMLA